jgi:hypothetical protein
MVHVGNETDLSEVLYPSISVRDDQPEFLYQFQ